MCLKQNRLMPIAALALIAGGCCCPPKMETTTDLQMEKMGHMREGANDHLTHMADNAILHEMALADFHFVPHTSELSGTGVARLDRMAVLLDTYGGTVRYDTALFDEELIQKRIDHVREYIALTGCEMNRVTVEAAISGGRGERAVKVIAADDKGTGQGSSETAAVPALLTPGG